ncbi:sigma-70 family RNA polymerase sigma factor [Mucilaginibacter sp. RS28]|uniref:Sigma-70 family RNA polymerase sigma factor n=1 Tax=Mucilaginibacter straminoryzae TaxID=2932774 RepID=A0A9X1X0J3_9SPHI|nr:sigma-70 family RNA polymerase sigma factor [Mucilaginibacter straminoryzae]MCJ8208401.1 sigma-70 family RNA polymerase sigma factor [Mucilaginibacter straminoryzae]
MEQMNDQQLWTLFLQGDQQAYHDIYALYYQNLYSYGLRKVNEPELVRDCIQDLFVNLWSGRKNLNSTDNIKYYLLASLKNLLIRAATQNTRWQGIDADTLNQFQLEFNLESEYIRKENMSLQAKALMDALDQLTPRQKEVLYLRYFEELSFEEIADLLDISVRAVYKLGYRAIDALKLILNLPKSDILMLLATYRIEISLSAGHFLR